MRIHNGRPEDSDIPMGLASIRASLAIEQRCFEESEKWLGRHSHHQEMLAGCGDILSLLDRAASCWWGCSGPGSPHAVEYLIGGTSSAGSAAVSLAFRGYYDESITAVRGIAERVNLLVLMVFDPSSFKEWISADEKVRRTKFSAFNVRTKIESLNQWVPFPRDYYSAFSGRGIHPGAQPQVYNPKLQPSTARVFQHTGFDVCIAELTIALCQFAILGIGILSHLPLALRQELWVRPMAVAEKMEGYKGIRLMGLNEFLANFGSRVSN